ncbi:hypothetical protein MUK42_15267 [Musa troglodytarum]|uniref:Uncharacterized protein n=1 Tax=Musa troglodytarum TaxID=320322 RepID=A0A9E7IE92_9LILI|nr:hypothetical protein MUK42_15267 [Musa troglodytarum]
MGEGMQCLDHPYRSNPGGVCAFCLQEKLGKLVSSSKTSPFAPLQPPPSSSSSPTSFRSDADPAVAESPRKKSFWSFLYLSSASSASSSSSAAHGNNINRRKSTSSSLGEEAAAPEQGENGVKETESPNAGQAAASSFGRKVARSRSVGCGSRSFSGDFLERISTGFGDCTLRRVESQREAKPNIGLHLNHDNDGEQQQPRMKERFKCGGLFGGFGTMYAYWLSAAAAEDDLDSSSRTSTATPAPSATAAARGRTRSWSLAFASPMRAFRPYSSSKPLYAIHNAASAAPATNIISSINASNGGKGHKLHTNPSFLAVILQHVYQPCHACFGLADLAESINNIVICTNQRASHQLHCTKHIPLIA